MSFETILKHSIAIIMLIYSIELWEVLAKSMELHTDECRHNPKHFDVFNLSINENTVYAQVRTRSQISQGFKFYINIELRLPNSQKYNSVFMYNVDVCRVLNSLRNNIYKKWLLSALQYGNFSAKCPVLPGYYYMKGWKLADDLIPGFVFSGEYRIQLNGFYGRHNTISEDMFVRCVFTVKLN